MLFLVTLWRWFSNHTLKGICLNYARNFGQPFIVTHPHIRLTKKLILWHILPNILSQPPLSNKLLNKNLYNKIYLNSFEHFIIYHTKKNVTLDCYDLQTRVTVEWQLAKRLPKIWVQLATTGTEKQKSINSQKSYVQLFLQPPHPIMRNRKKILTPTHPKIPKIWVCSQTCCRFWSHHKTWIFLAFWAVIFVLFLFGNILE